MLAEFDTTAVQVEPPSVDRSILYPVTGEPPLSEGAVQLRLICEEETVVAVTPVGAEGDAARVVPEYVFDGALVPIALIAETL